MVWFFPGWNILQCKMRSLEFDCLKMLTFSVDKLKSCPKVKLCCNEKGLSLSYLWWKKNNIRHFFLLKSVSFMKLLIQFPFGVLSLSDLQNWITTCIIESFVPDNIHFCKFFFYWEMVPKQLTEIVPLLFHNTYLDAKEQNCMSIKSFRFRLFQALWFHSY